MPPRRRPHLDILLTVAVVIPLLLLPDPIPETTSILTGDLYFQEIYNHENPVRFLDVTRFSSREDFDECVTLLRRGGLDDGLFICAGQKLMIFTHALKGASFREMKDRWQHSMATIHDVIIQVATCMIAVEPEVIIPPSGTLSDYIRSNPKFFPFFQHCIGAFDGTHIPAAPPSEDKEAFRGRKGVTQNVLAVCDWDMLFTYALAGWEGTAHDAKVLRNALQLGFPLIDGKYYLADAGLGLDNFCLVPYRGVRYHLKEWARARQRPQNREELFNLRHASLRNVIERIFGVVKKRFPILNNMHLHHYPFHFQVTLVRCVFILHNFLRRRKVNDDVFDAWNFNDVQDDDYDDEPGTHRAPAPANAADIQAWRDGIAEAMWVDYQAVLAQRGHATAGPQHHAAADEFDEELYFDD